MHDAGQPLNLTLAVKSNCLAAVRLPAHTCLMATPTLIPIEQYLSSSYEPDCDYLEGEIRKRNRGERPHSLLQTALTAIFYANRRAWNIIPMAEQRVQTSANRFRVPDVCLMRPGTADANDPIVRTPPILCVEVLSSGQTLRDMQERADDYLHMGVPQVWVIDPIRRQAFTPNAAGCLMPAGPTLQVEATPIHLELADLFREFDDLAAGR